MTTESFENSRTRVAVPYYGLMILPGSGLERVFFLVDIERGNGTSTNLGVQVWDAQAFPAFPHWLRSLGVEGVICADDHPVYEQAFRQVGIWVCWKQARDLEEAIAAWTRAQAA